jgi:hypothetical protein
LCRPWPLIRSNRRLEIPSSSLPAARCICVKSISRAEGEGLRSRAAHGTVNNSSGLSWQYAAPRRRDPFWRADPKITKASGAPP